MRGMICYMTGAVLYVLTGLLHGLAHFAPGPTDERLIAAQQAMSDAVQTMAGMSFSYADAMHCLSWYMTLFSLLTGLLAIALRKACRADARLRRVVSTLLAIGAAVLAAVAYCHGIFPPFLLYAIAALLCAAAAVRARA